MNSINDSVHKLLSDQIFAMKLTDKYQVQKAQIVGATGTTIGFVGLRHNIDNIKSLEACDIFWIEEAANVSKNSWDKLIPTIRKAGSEIWISFNPELETDETYKRFVLNPPSGAIVKKTSWRDNPWFPEALKIEMEDLRRRDPREYSYIYEGECRSQVEGAVYYNELQAAEKEGRIGNIPVDRSKPVDCFWDLGFGDSTAVWLAQALDTSYRIVGYLENKGVALEWYLIQLQNKGLVYGTHWLPWDGLKPQKLGTGRAIEEIMRAAGLTVRMVTMLPVHDGINAARTIFPECYFDAENCADGVMALRHYQWGPPSKTGIIKRDPLHNWASHGADAFRYLATALKRKPTPPRDPFKVTPFGHGPGGKYSFMR